MQGMLQLLRLVDALGKVAGRKKLQKIVHILQTQGYDFPQHFGYLHYGPFSTAVASEVDSLVSGGLVSESGSGQVQEPYAYEAKPEAKALLTSLNQTATPPWEKLAKELNKKTAMELEAISTILYLEQNGFDGNRLKTRFEELKPTLVNLFEQATETADKLPMSK